MTVQELINELQKIKDKSRIINGYDLYQGGNSLDIISINSQEENEVILYLDK